MGVEVRQLLDGWLCGCVVSALPVPPVASRRVLLAAAADGWPGMMWAVGCVLARLRPRLLACASPLAVSTCVATHGPAALADPATFSSHAGACVCLCVCVYVVVAKV